MSTFPGVYTFYPNTRATSNRRVKPFILAAIHITDNSALMSAMNEAIYSNRIGTGASFTFVNNRNGTTVQCLHPEWQIPYTNGSWRYPNRNLWTVNHALKYGIGANDSTFMTIENVGYESGGWRLTNEQVEKCARLIAHGSKLTGIKPNRATVLGHRDYDSVNRMYCPTRYDLNYLLGRIINRANALLGTAPAPTPGTIKVGGLPVSFTSRYGWKAVIKPYKPRRSGATLASSNYGNTDGNGEVFYVWGEVKGQDWGAGPRWFFGPQYINGWKIVYVPLVDLTSRNF
jgi:hypothetical protein